MDGIPFKKPTNPPPECYVPDKLITMADMESTALDLGESWTSLELEALMKRASKPPHEYLSEDDFLVFMGKKYLDGLPRDSYVREPWERTRRSTQMQEALYKCSVHYGVPNCLGANPV